MKLSGKVIAVALVGFGSAVPASVLELCAAYNTFASASASTMGVAVRMVEQTTSYADAKDLPDEAQRAALARRGVKTMQELQAKIADAHADFEQSEVAVSEAARKLRYASIAAALIVGVAAWLSLTQGVGLLWRNKARPKAQAA